MKINLYVWRQTGPNAKGGLEYHELDGVSEDMSFLEMFDILNEKLIAQGKPAVAFDHDCREGICGACSMVINGIPHGPEKETTTCQLHMRKFKDGETIYVEPFKARAFPVIRDLIVDRTALDRIIQAGGYVSVNTNQVKDANNLPVPRRNAELAMDAAACIGCGACVASCPNGTAMLFTSAKISQLALLPQGEPERKKRAIAMLNQLEQEGFGACSNYYECEAACPKGISVKFISKMNREYMRARVSSEED